MSSGVMIRQRFYESNAMAPKYEIGQQVIIRPVKNQTVSPRDSDIEPYAGQIGTITDYYSISRRGAEAFYIYTVKIESDGKEVVLHEDELESYMV